MPTPGPAYGVTDDIEAVIVFALDVPMLAGQGLESVRPGRSDRDASNSVSSL